LEGRGAEWSPPEGRVGGVRWRELKGREAREGVLWFGNVWYMIIYTCICVSFALHIYSLLGCPWCLPV
jgi:hypothetical protein